MPIITFRHSDEETRIEAPAGASLMTLAREHGIAIDAPCSGNGTCGKCRVRLLSGEVEAEQTIRLSDEDWAAGWRLACGSKVLTDAVIEVPDTAAAFRTGIRTADLNDPAVRAAFDDIGAALREEGFMDEPNILVRTVTLSEPTLDDTMPDNERLERAAAEELGVENVTLSFRALQRLARVLRESRFTVRCVLEKNAGGANILNVYPGNDTGSICGLAIDVGTTTVTGVLVDLESGKILARSSAGNGQIRYGADVINRIVESVRPGGSERLRKAVAEETLLPLIVSLCESAGVNQRRIYKAVIAGNTTMNHLLLGLFADPVRMEPFIPSFFRVPAYELSKVLPGIRSDASLIIAPNVGSYVGGDITAGFFASRIWESEELSLFIDLGTNGELVLGNNEYMMCCACSAGPAFEGGDISSGMRATDGAVDELTIDRETMEPRLHVLGPDGQKPLGLCGSGIIDMTAELFRTGIIDPRGKFAREGRRVAHDEHGIGRYIFAFADESADGRELSLNEVDIDNFIRAKGAIFSAIRLLLDQLGLTPEDIMHIQIAGGIGGGIDFENAVTIGMLPDVPRENFTYIGNSSLSGAYAMLLSRTAVEKVEELSRGMMYVELSNEPHYMDEFVSACFLPHTNANLFPSVEVL